MATYKEKSDLISIGAYQPGSDPAIDAAIAAREPIDMFLKQGVTEDSSAEDADHVLMQLATLGAAAQAGPVVTGQVVESAPAAAPQGGMPLHTAIPPLHIPS